MQCYNKPLQVPVNLDGEKTLANSTVAKHSNFIIARIERMYEIIYYNTILSKQNIHETIIKV